MDIIAANICQQMEVVGYPMSSPEDLEQTVKEVDAAGPRIVARPVDVRDVDALQQEFDQGTAELGPVTMVLANAGIGPGGLASEQQQWDEVIGVNLTGVWSTGRVAIPSMVEHGQGGAIVLTSSTGGLTGSGINHAGILGYTASKHGAIGLMRSWADYLAPQGQRTRRHNFAPLSFQHDDRDRRLSQVPSKNSGCRSLERGPDQ